MPQTQQGTATATPPPVAVSERKSGQIYEVPVSADVLKRTAAQELSDPPRFPTLK